MSFLSTYRAAFTFFISSRGFKLLYGVFPLWPEGLYLIRLAGQVCL